MSKEEDNKQALPFASRSADHKPLAAKDEDPSDDKAGQNHPITQIVSEDNKKPKLDSKTKQETKPEIKPVVPDGAPPQRRNVTIAGKRLQLTAAFDHFWSFIVARKTMDDRRRAGMPPP
jgi:hypothetical protein